MNSPNVFMIEYVLQVVAQRAATGSSLRISRPAQLLISGRRGSTAGAVSCRAPGRQQVLAAAAGGNAASGGSARLLRRVTSDAGRAAAAAAAAAVGCWHLPWLLHWRPFAVRSPL